MKYRGEKMKEEYIIGLDLGINNVGWSIVDSTTNTIEKCGVRLFSPSSDASVRRETRNVRRRLKRKDTRIKDVLHLLKTIGFPSLKTIDSKLIEKRNSGIHKQIEKQDITNIVCYLVSHRGYIPFGDEEVNFVDLEGKLPCEYYYSFYQRKEKYRALGKTVKNSDLEKELRMLLSVQKSFYPELATIEEELITIFKRKRKFWEGPGSTKALTPYGRFQTEEQVIDYLSKKEQNKNYEKYLFEDLIGHCKIALCEKCAPKLNFYAEQFNLLNDFINLSIKNTENLLSQDSVYLDVTSQKYKFTEESILRIFNYCISNTSVTIKKILSTFGLKIEDIEGYRVNKSQKPEFSTMEYYRSLLKRWKEKNLDISWLEDREGYNKVMYYLTVSPGVTELLKMIETDDEIQFSFNEEEKQLLRDFYLKLKGSSALGYHSLSEVVLKRAIQDMLAYQMNFMQVRKKFDYDKEAREYFASHYQKNEKGLPHMSAQFIDEIIASPQVKKTLRQAIRVINGIIDEKKSLPTVISIESSKEMNGKDRKKELDRVQAKQEKLRKEAKEAIIANYGEEFATESNIEKVMLFEEINGQCPYCNHPISFNDVMDNRIEVEHILPRSKSFDNSFFNKTLACGRCNKEKGARTPYQYLKAIGTYDAYKERIKNCKLISEDKMKNFLWEADLDKYKTRFFHRNLTDTAYATRELVHQVELFNSYLALQDKDLKILTLSTPGQLTHNVRTNQNLDKDRDIGKFHHAVDASIVAAIATTYFGKILIDSQNNPKFWMQNKDNLEENAKFLVQFHLSQFKEQLKSIDSDEKIKISSQVQKKPQKQLANANIYKLIKKEDAYYRIKQVDNIYLANFSHKDTVSLFEKLFDENNQTATLLCQDNDIHLFNYLKEIYETREEKSNPFVEYCIERCGLDRETEKFDYWKNGIQVPTKKGNGPIVVRLRYYEKITTPYLVEKDNIEKKNTTFLAFDSLAQHCTKVFVDMEENKFVFLPIYSISIDLNTGKLKENDAYYQQIYHKYIGDKKVKFLTDLYNGDWIEVKKKKDGKVIMGEYQYFHKTYNRIELKNKSIFTPSDIQFTIYDVDILGNRKKRLTYQVK